MMQSPNSQIYKNFTSPGPADLQSPNIKKNNISMEETNSSVVSVAKTKEDAEYLLRKNSELEKRSGEMERGYNIFKASKKYYI